METLGFALTTYSPLHSCDNISPCALCPPFRPRFYPREQLIPPSYRQSNTVTLKLQLGRNMWSNTLPPSTHSPQLPDAPVVGLHPPTVQQLHYHIWLVTADPARCIGNGNRFRKKKTSMHKYLKFVPKGSLHRRNLLEGVTLRVKSNSSGKIHCDML